MAFQPLRKPAPAAPKTAGPAPQPLKAAAAGVPVEPAHSPLERQAEAVARDVAAGREVPTVQANPTVPGARAARAARPGADSPPPVAPMVPPAATPEPARTPALTPPDGGAPLPEATRRTLEGRLGTSLDEVRVHQGTQARQTAADLQARAFTTGHDIWLGPGESADDIELMAHEVTHVLQQRDPAVPARLMRALPTPTTAPTTLTPAQGQVSADGSRLTFASLNIPGFKLSDPDRQALYAGRSKIRQRGYSQELRGNTAQRDIWSNDADAQAAVQAALVDAERAHAERARGAEDAGAGTPGHIFKAEIADRDNVFFFGTDLREVAQRLTLPNWERGRRPRWHADGYHVDHVVELQLANYPSDPWANTVANMELLDGPTNRDCGGTIDDNIDALLDTHIRAAGYPDGPSRSLRREIKNAYDIAFTAVAPGAAPRQIPQYKSWKRREILAGDHLRPVRAASAAELSPSNGALLVFPSPVGGIGKRFQTTGAVRPSERTWLRPLVISAKQLASGAAAGPGGAPTLGQLTIGIPDDHPKYKPFQETIDVERVPGAPLAGFVPANSVRSKLRRLEHKQTSPIEIDSFEIGPLGGIQMDGRIIPSLPFLHDAPIDFRVDGDNLELYKTFSAGELALPSPFAITDSSLTVMAGFGAAGARLGVEGEVNFEVRGLGQGQVGARVATGTPLTVFGSFDFDTRYFDPARLAFTYNAETGQWTGAGDLGLKPGTLPGVESATGHVEYDGTRLAGDLTVVPTMRALQQGVLSFSHSEAEGSRFAGRLTLSDAIPNVRGGEIEAVLTQPPGSDGWRLAARGDLSSSFAGFNQQLHVEYDQGGFVVEGSGDFARGMLAGRVTVGATNYSVDEAGQRGTEPTDTITAYGSGQVSVTLTPWLTATGRIRLLPNGEIELFGELALPPTMRVFDERPYRRRLFELNLDIPIIGFTVVGQRIGIFATVGAGLDLTAGIGPGQLRDTRLSVTYNPAHEDETTIHGHARFVVPAHAGLRMFVRGALGAGIPVVSAELGLEAGGEIGLAGEAAAEATVDWSPGHGLVLDALGSIQVQPRFKFDLTGYLEVTADLLIKEIDLYSERWHLGGFELGSSMTFGVEFPLHYAEGEPFDVNWDQVRFITPDVDVMAMMEDVISQVV